jgi:hypothetical protein
VTGPAIFALVAVLIGGFLLWRRPAAYASCVLFVLLLVSVAGLAMTSLGLPRPIWADPWMPDKVVVLGYALDEPKSIDLMIATPGGPRLYRLPWNEQSAADLNDASQKAKAQHLSLVASLNGQGKPGSRGVQNKEQPKFYPEPRAPLPDKQGE